MVTLVKDVGRHAKLNLRKKEDFFVKHGAGILQKKLASTFVLVTRKKDNTLIFYSTAKGVALFKTYKVILRDRGNKEGALQFEINKIV